MSGARNIWVSIANALKVGSCAVSSNTSSCDNIVMFGWEERSHLGDWWSVSRYICLQYVNDDDFFLSVYLFIDSICYLFNYLVLFPYLCIHLSIHINLFMSMSTNLSIFIHAVIYLHASMHACLLQRLYYLFPVGLTYSNEISLLVIPYERCILFNWSQQISQLIMISVSFIFSLFGLGVVAILLPLCDECWITAINPMVC